MLWHIINRKVLQKVTFVCKCKKLIQVVSILTKILQQFLFSKSYYRALKKGYLKLERKVRMQDKCVYGIFLWKYHLKVPILMVVSIPFVFVKKLFYYCFNFKLLCYVIHVQSVINILADSFICLNISSSFLKF